MESGFMLLTGETRRLAVTLAADAETAPGWFRAGVRDATTDALGALETLETARGSLATIAKDDNISDRLKAERLSDALKHAEGAARSYVVTATGHVGSLKLRLDKELTPARPDGVSDALLLDVKQDLAAILDRETTPDRVTEAAVKLAKAALGEGHALAFHALAGGPMTLVYDRHGIDKAALAERFADMNPAPAGKLRGKFRGPGSVPALVTMTAHAVDMALQELGDVYRPQIDDLERRPASGANR